MPLRSHIWIWPGVWIRHLWAKCFSAAASLMASVIFPSFHFKRDLTPALYQGTEYFCLQTASKTDPGESYYLSSMVSEQLFKRRCLWPKTSCRELSPALYLPPVTSRLPLKGEFVPGCLHQGARHMLWSPGQSMSSHTQLEGADHASFVRSWVGLWPGALQYQQAGTSSHDGVWLSGFCQLPLLQNLTGFGLDGGGKNSAPSVRRDGLSPSI